MRLRPGLLVVAFLWSSAVPGPRLVASTQSTPEAQRRFLLARAWLENVGRHTPGERDEALTRAAASTLPDTLEAIGAFRVQGEFTWTSLGFPRASRDRILARAAVLHADVVMLNQNDRGTNLPGDGRVVTLIGDGQQAGTTEGTFHWDIGRSLLALMTPGAERDDFALAWYRATTAFLRHWNDHLELADHLPQGRRMFPKAAVLLLYLGAEHEARAAPSLQVWAHPTDSGDVLRTAPGGTGRLSSGAPPDGRVVQSAGEERGKAETALRQALALDPALHEARIRLASVLAARGRHQDALAELGRVTMEGLPSTLAYFTHLFTGRSLHALGRLEAARSAFERALTLAPRAQSARLGLASVASETGDTAAVASALDVLRLSQPEAITNDPWFLYYNDLVPDFRALTADLYARLTR